MTPLTLTNIYAAYKLLIFDVDGTLADRASGELLPGRRQFFQRLTLIAYPAKGNASQIALASNQGGVGFRHWLESTPPAWFTEKSEAEQQAQLAIYPTQAEAEDRIHDVARTIRQTTQALRPFALPVRIYLSFAWLFKSNSLWAPKPPGTDKDPRWLQSYRKPGPGMLDEAMVDTDVSESQTLRIGDKITDIQAGQAAGCATAWSKDFFEEVGK